jgi:hypothetical protein
VTQSAFTTRPSAASPSVSERTRNGLPEQSAWSGSRGAGARLSLLASSVPLRLRSEGPRLLRRPPWHTEVPADLPCKNLANLSVARN